MLYARVLWAILVRGCFALSRVAWTRIPPAAVVVAVVALAVALLSAALQPARALAYDETGIGRPCVACHGTWESLETSRVGPHGGYTVGTNKCQTCHFVHEAAPEGQMLLPRESVKDTCQTCHDGTGGQGVYGVLAARGVTVKADHSIEATSAIPKGAPSGESTVGAFSAKDGTLTCSDCHSPHGTGVVEPFIGDRMRVSGDTTFSAVPSSRMLRQRPTGSETSVTVYGAGWCASCHRGTRNNPHNTLNHPVEEETTTPNWAFFYGRVARVAGVDTTATSIGALGGSNFGYVMPDLDRGQRTPQQTGHAPICQQCHEDARNVGDWTDPVQQGRVLPSEQFVVTELDGGSAGEEYTGPNNPRFQTFPHESQVATFLIEPDLDLCLNCHAK